ncbi:MAG: 3-phosphoshikimate 1-carboxyvinyltransferase, partial [Acidimicrobiales bacterium]
MAGLVIDPLVAPLDATVTLPGSKSLTNRALVAAALAHGRSRLTGVLFADDTEAMLDCLVRLRVGLVPDPRAATVEVVGTGGVVPDGSYELDARLSGTTSRFLLPVLALGAGDYRMDGAESLRQRPMGPLLDALRALGARVEQHGSPGHLPVTLSGGPPAGGAVALAGDVSSQFLSGLLLAAPAMVDGLRVALTTALVS